MAAEILAVCVSMPRTVSWQGNEVSTGIFKSPVEGRVAVSKMNIDGDGQADLTVHGGRDKAVYVYPAAHYPYWAAELGSDELDTAQFGENLTVTELDERNVCVGDRLRLGSVVAVVAQPRLPCFKLGLRMNDENFPARFVQTGRLGFYLRVQEEGELARGDTVDLIERAAHGITVHDLWQTVYARGEARFTAAECLENMPYLDAGWLRRLRQVAASA
ncbi:MAG: MOSC domain-containing protein [Woeseiaceae bacterium]